MIRKLVFILINLSLCIESHAAFTKLWDYRYGGSEMEFAKKTLETLNHGFLICGNSYSGISFDKTDTSRGATNDFWVVRTDSAGNILWDKTYGSMGFENFDCVALLADSGFLLGGSSNSNIGGEKSQDNHDPTTNTSDFWIIKIDKHGNKIWDKTYGGNNDDYLFSIAALTDGSFLLGGMTKSSLNGDMTHPSYGLTDYWVVKIDSAGTKLWDQNYGGTNSEELVTVNITSDKGFILGGRSFSPAGPSKTQNNINNTGDYWIVKIDSNGVKSWDRTLGGDGTEYFYTVNVLPGDKLLIGGCSLSNIGYDKSVANHGGGTADYWLIKTDSLGIKIWDKVYGGNDFEDDINNITILNGGFLITGTSYSNISGDKSQNNILNTEQPWVLALDSGGNKIWDLTISTVTHTEKCYGFQTYDGCFAFMINADADGGDVSQFRNSDRDFWLGKFCMNGSLPIADYLAASSAFCQNTCIDFTNASINANSYQWFFPGGTPASSTQANPQGICYNASGMYDVTLVAFNGNGTDTLTLSQYLTVFPQVPFTPITQIADTLFSVPGYATYQWYSDTVLIPGASSYYYVANHSGDYSVIVTDTNGCYATAYKTNVIAFENDISSTNYHINIYSTADKIIINSDNLFSTEVKIIIANTLGEIIYVRNSHLRNGENELYLDDLKLSSGIYIVSVQNSDKKIFEKLFIN